MLIVAFDEENRTILRNSDILFGDAALDIDQQLLAGKRQYVYTLNGDCYCLSAPGLLSVSDHRAKDNLIGESTTELVHVGCNAPIPRIRGRHCNVYT